MGSDGVRPIFFRCCFVETKYVECMVFCCGYKKERSMKYCSVHTYLYFQIEVHRSLLYKIYIFKSHYIITVRLVKGYYLYRKRSIRFGCEKANDPIPISYNFSMCLQSSIVLIMCSGHCTDAMTDFQAHTHVSYISCLYRFVFM